MRKTPIAELEHRIARVQAALRREGMDGAVFVQGADLYYLAGTSQQCHLLVPAEGDPLLTVRRDRDRAREESALTRVEDLTSLRELPGALGRAGIDPAGVLGFELDVLPVIAFRRYEAVLSGARLVDCSPLIRAVRAVKSEYEVAIMREAAVMADLVVRAAATLLRVGMTELELSARLEAVAREAGHQGIVRFRAFGQELPIIHVFAGPEAAVRSAMDTPLGGRGISIAVPQGAGRRPIGRGEPVVIDMAGAVDGYLVDQTRVLSLGPLAPDLREAYGACLDIQDFLRREACPGRTGEELFLAAVERAEALGFGDRFMGASGGQVAFVGHGVGLEADELPVIGRGGRDHLVPGNTVAIEPKIVFPGRGVVGVENTWVVESDGLRALTFSDESLVEVA